MTPEQRKKLEAMALAKANEKYRYVDSERDWMPVQVHFMAGVL